jgi:hypothetical protein
MAMQLSGSINLNGSLTGSIFATNGLVSSSTQVQNYDVFALNSNLYTATGSLIGITNGLMAFTAALDSTYATDAQLLPILQTTASLNIFTGSIQSEVSGIEAYTASLKGAAIVSSSQQITNYYKFAETASANTFYGNQSISGSLNVGSNVSVQSGNTLKIYRTDNTRALQLYTTNDECVIDSWEASAEPLHIRSMGAGGRIQFFTSGSEKLRITPDGYQRMATGTKGIQFNGDTAAANALNDYEEGTWTPTYTGTNITITSYGNRNGYYTKIGRLVTITFNIMTEAVSVIGSENVNIEGLPFAAANVTENTNAVNIFDNSRWTSTPPVGGSIAPGASIIQLNSNIGNTGAGQDPTRVVSSNMATGAGNRNMVRATATYFTA